jgi:outer membrane protein assembly factor BamB
MDGELVAVDITVPQYKELWTIDLQIGYDHAPCVVTEADGVVYAGSRHGVVTAVDPFSQQILWSRQLGQSEINGFELDEFTHNIYLSLVEGTIFVIENKQNL